MSMQGDLVISGTALHSTGALTLYTNEHPDGLSMMKDGEPLGYMDPFGPQLDNFVWAIRAHAPLLRDPVFAAGGADC